MSSISELTPVAHRPGDWLPKDPKHLQAWLRGLVAHVKSKKQTLNPVLQEFKELIENDIVLWQYFHLMFEQIPAKPPYDEDPTGRPEIRDYITMLNVFNVLMTRGPPFIYNTEGQKGLVGFPINAVLDWPMGTAAGVSAFLDPRVNVVLKKMLNAWAVYLASPESASILSEEDGWLDPQALCAMASVASDGGEILPFDQVFICDKTKPAYGFTSWDDFFVRKFREGQRPVELADNDRVINNACESTKYRIARNVKERDSFWIKEQPYSLCEMLAGDPSAKEFVGGTIYQAFLSALSYHRWHSPVSGKILKVQQLPGTYYAENYWEGFANPQGPDPSAPNDSQGYITEVATRAVVYIEADNPQIGLMGIVFVGMAEVSSCDVTVKENDIVKKGDDLGMFHFGGSTHCLLFRPGVVIDFEDVKKGKNADHNVKVRSALGVVRED